MTKGEFGNLVVGQKVYHPAWGEAVIVEVERFTVFEWVWDHYEGHKETFSITVNQLDDGLHQRAKIDDSEIRRLEVVKL